jgi:D-aminoacyl-tRNA deacylase
LRALVQRVREASVTVEGRITGAIGPGLLVLVGIGVDDTEDETEDDTEDETEDDRRWLARKIVGLRIFDDTSGVMNLSIAQTGGGLLAVSQFTLYASTRKGSRPSWSAAAPPALAQTAFDAFLLALAHELGRPVATGVFGAHMAVALVNDGPVTIWLDSRARE